MKRPSAIIQIPSRDLQLCMYSWDSYTYNNAGAPWSPCQVYTYHFLGDPVRFSMAPSRVFQLIRRSGCPDPSVSISANGYLVNPAVVLTLEP